MRFEPAWATAAALCLSASCLKFDPFACSDDTQCNLDGLLGQCQPSGFCAYPDIGCPSGLRYEEHAGSGLGGACVGPEADTEAVDASSTSKGADSESSGSDPDTSTSVSTDETGDACGGPGQPCCAAQSCDDGLICAGEACGCALTVAAGNRHACAIKVDGSVWCWGANEVGQVRAPAGAAELVPVSAGDVFGPVGHASSLSARNHTCGLRDDGVAFCWGANAAGQSDPTDALGSVDPREATWAAPTTGIGAGLSHTCAIRSRGTVVSCWGANGQDQLTTGDAPGPVNVPGELAFVQLELGDAHACGRTATGELWCWGDNAQGQLADDPAVAPTHAAFHAVPVPAVDEIALGARHSCARSGNDVWCWGRNGLGQLGDGSGVQQSVPVPVVLPPGLPIASIVSGPDHTCVIDDGGGLWCWGSNMDGQLMLEADPVTGDDTHTLVPVEIDVGASVLAFAGGATHSCALVTTAEILCWGKNTEGQIGNGNQFFAHEPEPVDLACP